MLAWLVISGVAAVVGLALGVAGGLIGAVWGACNDKAAVTTLVLMFVGPVMVYGGIASGLICGVVWIAQAVSA